MEELTILVVGQERAGWQYRIGSLAQRGVQMAFGSDWPVSNADPLQEIHVAVNRRLSIRGRSGAHARGERAQSRPAVHRVDGDSR
jgi:predicted amidohydrolase YtcJ